MLHALEYTGEYGTELGVFVPHVHFLKKNGLLHMPVISYNGMRPYYYFLDDHEFFMKNVPRDWVHPHGRVFLPSHLESDDIVFGEWNGEKLSAYDPPPYHTVFSQFRIPSHKPIVLIQNKYNSEWGGPPVNFFDTEELVRLVEALQTHFTVVYLRTNGFRGPGYSHDVNEMQSFVMNEKPILLERFPEIVLMEDLLQHYHGRYDFNTLKCILQSNAVATISTIGGFNYFDAYFPSTHVIYRKDCPPQYNKNFYQNQHDLLCPDHSSEILFASKWEELMQCVEQLKQKHPRVLVTLQVGEDNHVQVTLRAA